MQCIILQWQKTSIALQRSRGGEIQLLLSKLRAIYLSLVHISGNSKMELKRRNTQKAEGCNIAIFFTLTVDSIRSSSNIIVHELKMRPGSQELALLQNKLPLHVSTEPVHLYR